MFAGGPSQQIAVLGAALPLALQACSNRDKHCHDMVRQVVAGREVAVHGGP